MSEHKVAIFDFDGTLANSVDLIVDLYNEHAGKYDYETITADEFPQLRRMGYRQAMNHKGIKLRKVPRMVMHIGKEMRTRMTEVEPYDGVQQVLKKLKKDGYMVGILTSNQASLVQDFLHTHTFPKLDFIVSERAVFGKDKALSRIMKRYDLSNDQIVYIGDEPRDVVACNKANIQIVGVTWGLGGKEGYELNKPDVVVSDMKDLKPAIDKLSK